MITMYGTDTSGFVIKSHIHIIGVFKEMQIFLKILTALLFIRLHHSPTFAGGKGAQEQYGHD